MLLKLILLLTVVPAVELYLLLQLTHATGLEVTAAVIVATGVAGAFLTRLEGLRVIRRVQSELEAGRVPADELLDGVIILVAGALLVTPGLVTDAMGFLLLFPPTRRLVRKLIKRWFWRRTRQGRVHLYRQMGFGPIGPEEGLGEEERNARDSGESGKEG